jgi:hypothetical protein
VIFLILYDRATGRIEMFRTFLDADREAAANERLDIELALTQQGKERDVLILEAASEEALRKTHGRFFKDWTEITAS